MRSIKLETAPAKTNVHAKNVVTSLFLDFLIKSAMMAAIIGNVSSIITILERRKLKAIPGFKYNFQPKNLLSSFGCDQLFITIHFRNLSINKKNPPAIIMAMRIFENIKINVNFL